MNDTLEKVYIIAKEIREQTQLEMGTDCMSGLCKYCSKQIQKILTLEGIRTKLINGSFRIDKPEIIFKSSSYVSGELFFPSHYWLEFKGFIIDITADQFNNELNKNYMNEIIIGRYSDFPRYKK